MISLKTGKSIDAMRRAGKISAAARALAGSMVEPGISTRTINKAVHDYIVSQGAIPSFLDYNGFPASICISINEQVIHGIPGSRRIKNGDIVSIDVGAFIAGFHGDCSATFLAGNVSEPLSQLVKITRESFFEALKYAYPGNRVPDISHAIQSYVEKKGYSIVRDYVGHGVGAKLHEEPEVPNFGSPGHGVRLLPGMTLAIEPMVNQGAPAVRVLADGWTVVTRDGLPSAHYENTVLITNGEPEILTPVDGDGAYA